MLDLVTDMSAILFEMQCSSCKAGLLVHNTHKKATFNKRILNKTETTWCFLELIKTHNNALDISSTIKQLVYLLLSCVK